MSEFKGTKGKWELTNNKRGIEVHIKPTIYKSICSSTGNTKWQYDMLLISKAPEMLKELNNIVDCWDKDVFQELDIDSIRNLIKQATDL